MYNIVFKAEQLQLLGPTLRMIVESSVKLMQIVLWRKKNWHCRQSNIFRKILVFNERKQSLLRF